MSGPQDPTRYLVVTTNQWRLWLEDKLGHFLEPVVIALVGGLFSVFLLVIGHYGEAAIVIAHAAVSAGIVFFVNRAHRQDSILLEVTMSYLIQGEKPLLDHLLGRLIGGQWKRNELKPGSALFDVLDKIAQNESPKSWEIKRRIAEALPALAEASPRRTLKIIQTLREDWDEERYKSDLRRRAVEALITPLRKGHGLLIDRLPNEEIAGILTTRDGDQVFTAFAIAEALTSWNSELSARLLSDLSEFARQKYSSKESNALDELIDFLAESKTSDAFKILRRLSAMATDANEFVRIAAARNVLIVSDRLVDNTLDLMLGLSDPTQPRNVRRPISKEQSVGFLIDLLGQSRTRERAEQMMLRLASDVDQIIRVTVFDMSDALLRNDPIFLKAICHQILKTENAQPDPSLELIERVTRTQLELAA